jgi:hypothetical protein
MFKRRRNKESKENLLQDKMAKGIAGFLMKVQAKFADCLNRGISGISIKRMKVLVVLFCLLWGGLSIYFIAKAVYGPKQSEVKVDKIKLLQHINQQGEREVENRVNPDTYRQIQEYKRYMDSARQAIRPGLLDSMNVLEQIYLSQQKNDANEK